MYIPPANMPVWLIKFVQYKVAGIHIRRLLIFQTAVAKVSRVDMSHISAPLLLLLLLLRTALCSGAASTTARHNVVMIIFDDLRPALGVYGDSLARTPHLDAFAQGSNVFSHAYSQVSPQHRPTGTASHVVWPFSKRCARLAEIPC